MRRDDWPKDHEFDGTGLPVVTQIPPHHDAIGYPIAFLAATIISNELNKFHYNNKKICSNPESNYILVRTTVKLMPCIQCFTSNFQLKYLHPE